MGQKALSILVCGIDLLHESQMLDFCCHSLGPLQPLNMVDLSCEGFDEVTK